MAPLAPPDRLTPEQTQLWRAFRKMTDRLGEALTRRLDDATGLSAPEFGVLGMLEELGQGTARQAQVLALSGWDKSRLSHLLRRMEARGLVERRPAGAKGVTVAATARGRALHGKAAPVHARALRELFFDRLGPAQRDALADLVAHVAHVAHVARDAGSSAAEAGAAERDDGHPGGPARAPLAVRRRGVGARRTARPRTQTGHAGPDAT